MNRGEQVHLGKETLDRVIKRLLESADCAATQDSIANYFPQKQYIQIQPGTDYLPDLETFINGHAGLEIKGIHVSWTRTSDKCPRAGRLKLLRDQWAALVAWCKQHNAEPQLLVELKTLSHNCPYLYFRLKEEAVNKLIKRTNARSKWILANIWELIEAGEKI